MRDQTILTCLLISLITLTSAASADAAQRRVPDDPKDDPAHKDSEYGSDDVDVFRNILKQKDVRAVQFETADSPLPALLSGAEVIAAPSISAEPFNITPLAGNDQQGKFQQGVGIDVNIGKTLSSFGLDADFYRSEGSISFGYAANSEESPLSGSTLSVGGRWVYRVHGKKTDRDIQTELARCLVGEEGLAVKIMRPDLSDAVFPAGQHLSIQNMPAFPQDRRAEEWLVREELGLGESKDEEVIKRAADSDQWPDLSEVRSGKVTFNVGAPFSADAVNYANKVNEIFGRPEITPTEYTRNQYDFDKAEMDAFDKGIESCSEKLALRDFGLRVEIGSGVTWKSARDEGPTDELDFAGLAFWPAVTYTFDTGADGRTRPLKLGGLETTLLSVFEVTGYGYVGLREGVAQEESVALRDRYEVGAQINFGDDSIGFGVDAAYAIVDGKDGLADDKFWRAGVETRLGVGESQPLKFRLGWDASDGNEGPRFGFGYTF